MLKNHPGNPDRTALYVISFNSPRQFEALIDSMLAYDADLIEKPKKFLLDNSSDLSCAEKYAELCGKFGFEHIKKDNIGICGGRQFVAEHAEEHAFDFYFFFEDDMLFYTGNDRLCKNGFNRYAENLYVSAIEIVKENGFDFLKMNYTEFYGNNGTQWAWYNVPQDFREVQWPENKNLPVQGHDPNAPKTVFRHIKSHHGIPFVDGQIYYSNWPQVVTRHGNKKMFLEVRWEKPYEQIWMSHLFQETVKGALHPALLLMTPTEHTRFDFYEGALRKES